MTTSTVSVPTGAAETIARLLRAFARREKLPAFRDQAEDGNRIAESLELAVAQARAEEREASMALPNLTTREECVHHLSWLEVTSTEGDRGARPRTEVRCRSCHKAWEGASGGMAVMFQAIKVKLTKHDLDLAAIKAKLHLIS